MRRKHNIMRAVAICTAVATVCSLSMLCGCTPHNELKDLAIVEAIGVDLDEDGTYLLTFQILDPSGGSGGEGAGKTSINNTNIVQSKGKSIFSASLAATRQMGRMIFYSSNRVLVLGRAICKKGIYQVIDSAERNHETVPTLRIFMAEDMAQDILTARNAKGYITGDQINKISQKGFNTSMVSDLTISDLERQVSMGLTDICLPVLKVKQMKGTSVYQQGGSSSSASGSPSSSGSSSDSESSSGQTGSVTIEGSAIFCEGRFVDVIDSMQTRGVLWVREKDRVNGGAIVVNTDGGTVSLEIIGSSSSITADEKNGRPQMKVYIGLKLKLAEIIMKDYTMDERFISQLNTLAEEEVRSEARSAVDTALKDDDSDIFGFGEKMFQTRPELWHKEQKTWRQDLSKVDVSFEINSSIEDIGQMGQ